MWKKVKGCGRYLVGKWKAFWKLPSKLLAFYLLIVSVVLLSLGLVFPSLGAFALLILFVGTVLWLLWGFLLLIIEGCRNEL